MCRIVALFAFLASSFGILGCGGGSRPTSGDDGHGHGASYACGTEEEPAILVLKDVKPGAGETVSNRGIVEQFTLVDAPFMVQEFPFVLLSKHTAGTSSPSPLQLTVDVQGKDLVYSATIDSWATAPGHVERGLRGFWKNDNGCAFAFPSPLFSYDITAP